VAKLAGAKRSAPVVVVDPWDTSTIPYAPRDRIEVEPRLVILNALSEDRDWRLSVKRKVLVGALGRPQMTDVATNRWGN